MVAKRFFYDSVDDGARRLSKTVVMHKGEPVWLQDVMGLNTDQQATISRLPLKIGKDLEVVSLVRDDFEIRQLPCLGYVDYKGSSYYIRRIPVRQGKQGYFEETTEIPVNHQGYIPTFKQLISTTEFVSMMMNKYPKFDKVFEEIIESDEETSKSFKKTFSLSMDDMSCLALNYRGQKVAIANNPKKYGPVFRLPKQFRYLTEELNESGIRID